MIDRLVGEEVEQGEFLPAVIDGVNDGIVTTFAVIAGVAGAALEPRIVLIVGAANVLADGFSIATSNFFSCRAEEDHRETVEISAEGVILGRA